MSEIETQKVWRTMSASMDGGFRVWDIAQVIGEPVRSIANNYIVPCRDGSWIYAICCHYWTIEAARDLINNRDKWLDVEIITRGELSCM